MPIYEYKCPECGAVEEAIKSYESADNHECSSCGVQMNRIFSTFAAGNAKPESAGGSSCATGTCPFA